MHSYIPEPILEFQHEFRFLSNFWIAPQRMKLKDGTIHTFNCNEQWYVYNKCIHELDRQTVLTLTKPGDIKRFGRTIEINPLFDIIKLDVMLEGLRNKFHDNEDLADKLMATGHRALVEGNRWGDMFWGVNLNSKKGLVGSGKNMLGQLLMLIRTELLVQKELKDGDFK